MIEYIFRIGIIYIVFSLIWAFFLLLYNMITGFNNQAVWQTFLMKSVKMYFLISIVAIFTIQYMQSPRHSAPLIATVGLLTLYSYMVGRLQQKRMMLQINNRFGNFSSGGAQADLRIESALIVIGLVYFTLCLYNHSLPQNKVNHWFYKSVNDIYDTPVIGWIIGFFGILFLLGTLLKAALVTVSLINNLQNTFSGKNKGGNNRDNERNDDGGYADYEIMD
jgi:hypothetical protein